MTGSTTNIHGSNIKISELDELLTMTTQAPQLLFYDTKFQLGDFYVSTFIFRATCLFLIHERKF